MSLQADFSKILGNEKLAELYHSLILPRMIEEEMLLALRRGEISKWFSGMGQEAIAVGVASALGPEDLILPMHRNLGVFTTRGLDLEQLFSQVINREGGFTSGRERTFHFGSLKHNIVGMISHVGAMLPVATGFATSFLLNGEDRIAVPFTGDGAASEGDFHEALNLAAVWNLPVIFLVENNGYALSTPTSEQFASSSIVDRAAGYGIEGVQIDGNDLLEVYSTFTELRKEILKQPRPFLVEAMTFRMRGHEEASGTKYVPEELFEKWAQKDPILRFEKLLFESNALKQEETEKLKSDLRADIRALIDRVVAKSQNQTTEEYEEASTFSPLAHTPIEPGSDTHELRFVDAVKEGLEQKLEADPSVIVIGQDVAEYGGVFKVTEGFVEKFGKERIRNTPIIESGAVGAALGMSLNGLKPVLEMQFSDFVTCGFNQIINNLAKNNYRWNESVNVTIRLPSGGGVGAGPFHSQSIEAWFMHAPGLKIVMPSTPLAAKGLLLSAIDDPNPVLFFEHKALYRSEKGEVPVEPYHIEIGKARVARQGSDATIVTYGLAVSWALEVAAELANSGRKLEVIDLQTLLPWDRETVYASVEKTNRLLVLHEASLTGGVGAEIAATCGEHLFGVLDAPVMRVASLDTPVPANSTIEKEIFWPKKRLRKALEKLLTY